MSDGNPRVTIKCNVEELLQFLTLLEKFANFSLKICKRLLNLFELSTKVVTLRVDDDPAATAGQIRTCLQIPKPLSDLMPALRAIELNLLIVEHRLTSFA